MFYSKKDKNKLVSKKDIDKYVYLHHLSSHRNISNII